MKVILIGFSDSDHLDLIQNIIYKNNISYERLNIDRKLPEISLSNFTIKINNEELKYDDLVYLHGIKPYFLNPPYLSPANFTSFSFKQVEFEQKVSLIFSLVELAKDVCKVVDSPIDYFDNYSKYSVLKALKESGLNLPDTALTSSLQEFSKTELYVNNNYFYWSFPVSNTPIKSISKSDLPQLLTEDRNLPIILYEYSDLERLKIWLYKNKVILVANYKTYDDTEYYEKLETYEYLENVDRLSEFGDFIFKILDNKFLEIEGIIIEGQFWIYNCEFEPDLSNLGDISTEYIISKLLNMLSENEMIKTPQLKQSEGRTNVALKRSLRNLLELAND